MKNIYQLLVTTGLLISSSIVVAQTYKADVPSKTQEQNQWCWATDSQCVLEYYGTKKKQCEIVEYARTLRSSTFGTTPCCTSPSGKCNNPNEIKYNYGITGMLSYFGNISSIVSDGPITVTKITDELKNKRPFIIGIFWNGGGGHVVVGCGYDQSAGSLTFMDSWQGNSFTTMKYSSGKSVTTRTGTGSWVETLVITTPYTPTGIADAGILKGEVTMYPNPSNGSFHITSEQNLKAIYIYNATGQLINTYTLTGEKTYALTIPVSGFYNIQVVSTDNSSAYKRVVINNN